MTDLSRIASEFRPAFFAPGPHWQMIVSHALMRRRRSPAEDAVLTVPLSDGEALAVLENLPAGPPAGGVLLMHGLGGSSRAKYMTSATERLLAAGFAVFRMNQRGAAEGAPLVSRLYHAGLGGDIGAVLAFLAARHPKMKIYPVGFSMSGNTLFKYLAETSALPENLGGAVGMNPALDLTRCMEAVEAHGNRFYQRRFTKLLVAQRLAIAPPDRREASAKQLEDVEGIREFDRRVTVPAWGFGSPENYYASQSALPQVEKVRCPTVLVTAEDDPLVPVEIFRDAPLPECVSLRIVRGGGHMGYLSAKKTPLGDRRFQDYFLVEAVRFLAGTPVSTEDRRG